MHLEEIFIHKKRISKNEILLIRIYRVDPNPNQPEGILYSLAYFIDEVRVIAYDNYNKEGHHMNINDKKYQYEFINRWQLIRDFQKSVEEYKRERSS